MLEKNNNDQTGEKTFKPASWPLLFSYKSRLFGKGYIAEINLCGRLLAELEVEGVWLYGVNPGAIAVGAATLSTANVDLHRALCSAFADFAEQAETFDEFKTVAEKFFNENDRETEIEWEHGLARMKASATIEAPGGLPIKDGVKTRVFITVEKHAADTITPQDNNRGVNCVAEDSKLATAAQMSGFGRVPLSAVWAMSDVCARGSKRIKRTHNWCIYFGTETYPTFPTGEHGKADPEIELGHVKKMARHLGILDCAKKQIEALK